MKICMELKQLKELLQLVKENPNVNVNNVILKLLEITK